MLDWLYGLSIAALYPIAIVLIAAATLVGNWVGLRSFRARVGNDSKDIGTLTGAALGLLALLLAFCFSIALARFDARRTLVLEEANAIGSTVNFALMLPRPAQAPIVALLRDYAVVRRELGIPYDPAKMRRDIARSLDLQARLWQQAVAATAAEPQSLPVYRFVASLNEVNNIHESRITALRFHVPSEVMFMLVGVAAVAMGFTGYHAGLGGHWQRAANLIMSVMVAVLIILVIDLDRPDRGLITVSNQALVDAVQSMPP